MCLECGLLQGRVLNTQIMSYNTFVERSSCYTRKYRFKCLLNELCGRVNFPADLAKLMIDQKQHLVSPKRVRDILIEHKLFKRYCSKIPAILIWNGAMDPPLDEKMIAHCCAVFQIVDRQISILSGKKPAFTFLLPVILRICGLTILADSRLLREPSALLTRKYGEAVEQALISLGYDSHCLKSGQ